MHLIVKVVELKDGFLGNLLNPFGFHKQIHVFKSWSTMCASVHASE